MVLYLTSLLKIYVGLHRYVFLIYKQTGILQDTDHKLVKNTQREGRLQWKTSHFAKKHALGNPVAGNFYQVSSF